MILIKKKCPISRVTKRGIGIKNGPFISPFYGGFFRFAFFTSNNGKFSFMLTFAWDSDTYTLLFLLGDSLSQKKTVV